MRAADKRTRKYAAKLGGMVLPGQSGRFKDKIARQVELEQMVKAMAADLGIGIVQLPYYIIYAKELQKIIDTHGSEITTEEIEIIKDKWETRGLDSDALRSIRNALRIEPGPIDVGKVPVISGWAMSDNFTIISLFNPCNGTGNITQWKCWIFNNLVGMTAKMKIFRDDGTNYVFVNETAYQAVNQGLNTFACTEGIQTGDLIAIITQNTAGSGCCGTGNVSGAMWKAGDIYGSSAKGTWTSNPTDFSLYGTGTGL